MPSRAVQDRSTSHSTASFVSRQLILFLESWGKGCVEVGWGTAQGFDRKVLGVRTSCEARAVVMRPWPMEMAHEESSPLFAASGAS